jgi:hypothetical protein
VALVALLCLAVELEAQDPTPPRLPSGQAGQAPPAPAAEKAPAPEPWSLPLLNFIGKPKWRRIRQQAGIELSGDVTLTATVQVRDRGNQPLSGKTVTLLGYSPAGPFKSERGVTDSRGLAAIPLTFDSPLGSLALSVRCCLSDQPSACTETVELSLRNWVDFDLGFDLAYLIIPNPSAGKGQQAVEIYADNIFSTVLWPRLQFNLWETEYKWRYYSFGIYGTVPGIFQDRSVLIPKSTGGSAALHSVERRTGLGDFAAGANLNLRGNLFADVAYNGKTGRFNLVDSIRNLGRPGAVNLGDGFESIDASVQLSHLVGTRGPLLFGVGSNSRARPRRYPNGDRAERGDFYQATGGLGLIRKSRSSAVLFWGGYARYEATRLQPAGKGMGVVSPARDDWMVGLTRTGLRRGPVSLTAGAYAGGLGREQVYIGLNLRLDFHFF